MLRSLTRRCSEFYGKRYAVEATANICNNWCILISQHELTVCRSSSIDEERESAVGKGAVGINGGLSIRHRQRRNPINGFASDPEGLARRRDDSHFWAALQGRRNNLRYRVQKVLAIVEYEQGSLELEKVRHRLNG
jgi:hypothetical protein